MIAVIVMSHRSLCEKYCFLWSPCFLAVVEWEPYWYVFILLHYASLKVASELILLCLVVILVY